MNVRSKPIRRFVLGLGVGLSMGFTNVVFASMALANPVLVNAAAAKNLDANIASASFVQRNKVTHARRTDARGAELVQLPVGGLQVLAWDSSVMRVAIASGDILESRQIDSRSVLLVALTEGYSEVKVWTEDTIYTYAVEVGPRITASRSKPVIELEVQVVEFKSRQLQSLGIRWQQVVNGPNFGVISDWAGGDQFRVTGELDGSMPGGALQLPSGHYSYAGLAATFRSQLHLLNEQGQARMLASPVLRTESGQTAEFLAGGEVPLPQSNQQGAMDVSFRSYGIGLKILPEQLDDGSIRTQVITEVSNLDPAVSVQGIPGLLTRRTESVVAVEAEETFVISGLRSEDASFSEEAVPGLSRLPAVGKAFRHRQQQYQETELVIFITPRVVNNDTQVHRTRRLRVDELRRQLLQTPCRGMQNYL